MTLDYAKILICPHCKGEKEILSLMSGNSLGGRQWWDLKKELPMLPHVSLVQKCPHCGKYFMTYSVDSREGEDYSHELGKLSHAEMRKAYAQLKDTLSSEDLTDLLFEYVWAYNDAFQREDTERATPSEEDQKEFQTVVRELVTLATNQSRIFHAELLREAKFFDEALAIVEEEGEQKNPILQQLSVIIREKSAKKDSSVGLVPRI